MLYQSDWLQTSFSGYRQIQKVHTFVTYFEIHPKRLSYDKFLLVRLIRSLINIWPVLHSNVYSRWQLGLPLETLKYLLVCQMILCYPNNFKFVRNLRNSAVWFYHLFSFNLCISIWLFVAYVIIVFFSLYYKLSLYLCIGTCFTINRVKYNTVTGCF